MLVEFRVVPFNKHLILILIFESFYPNPRILRPRFFRPNQIQHFFFLGYLFFSKKDIMFQKKHLHINILSPGDVFLVNDPLKSLKCGASNASGRRKVTQNFPPKNSKKQLAFLLLFSGVHPLNARNSFRSTHQPRNSPPG